MLHTVTNPARITEVVGRVALASRDDVEQIIGRAHAAFAQWSATKVEERADRLRAAAADLKNALPQLTTLFVRENGKPRREAERDIRRSIELMELVAGELPQWWKPEIVD